MSQSLFQPRFNVKSWHSRVHRFIYDESPDYHASIHNRISICRYFWSTALASFLFGLVAIVYPFYWVGKKADKSLDPETKRRIGRALETGGKVVGIGFITLVGGVLTAIEDATR